MKGMVTHGFEGCDALATWISQGLIMGPFKESEVPVHKLRISPLNVEIKPNSREFFSFMNLAEINLYNFSLQVQE